MAPIFCGHPLAPSLGAACCWSPRGPEENMNSGYCGMPQILSWWCHAVIFGTNLSQTLCSVDSFSRRRGGRAHLYIALGRGGRGSPYVSTKDCCGNMGRWWGLFLGSSATPDSSMPPMLMSTVAYFPLYSSIRQRNWGNLGWILKILFGWAFILQNENTSVSDLCLPNSQVERKEYLIDVLVLFCALSSVLCDGLLLHSGSHTSVDAVVCVDCVQKSNAMKHVPPAAHFQDAFSLPHVNKYPESKFSFSEPKTCLFLQTFGKYQLSICIFILNLQTDRQLIVVAQNLATWKCKHK